MKKKRRDLCMNLSMGTAAAWMHKKACADREAQELELQVEQLFSWVTAMDSMDDARRREFVLAQAKPKKPPQPKQVRMTVRSSSGNSNGLLQVHKPNKVSRARQSKCSSSSSNSYTSLIMAAVWKFHSDDDAPTTIS